MPRGLLVRRLCGGFGAVGVEGAGEFLRDGRGGAGLNGRALHEIDELAVAEDGNGRRGGWVAAEVAASLVRGVAVLAGEDGDGVVRLGGVLHSHTDAGTHFAGSATADGVDDKHRRAGLGDGCIHVRCGASLIDAGARELFAHRDDHNLWVHCGSPLGKILLGLIVAVLCTDWGVDARGRGLDAESAGLPCPGERGKAVGGAGC